MIQKRKSKPKTARAAAPKPVVRIFKTIPKASLELHEAIAAQIGSRWEDFDGDECYDGPPAHREIRERLIAAFEKKFPGLRDRLKNEPTPLPGRDAAFDALLDKARAWKAEWCVDDLRKHYEK